MISSIAVVTRDSIGRTVSSVMRSCTEFVSHYSVSTGGTPLFIASMLPV